MKNRSPCMSEPHRPPSNSPPLADRPGRLPDFATAAMIRRVGDSDNVGRARQAATKPLASGSEPLRDIPAHRVTGRRQQGGNPLP